MTKRMKAKRILSLTLAAGLAVAFPAMAKPRTAVSALAGPQGEGGRGKPAKAEKSQASMQHGSSKSGPKNVKYQFRSRDTTKLREHYQTKIKSINRSTRPQVVVGTYIIREYVTYIEPCPVTIVQYLPPPPPGYIIGFWNGFVIVYDPGTLFVAGVVDLA